MLKKREKVRGKSKEIAGGKEGRERVESKERGRGKDSGEGGFFCQWREVR